MKNLSAICFSITLLIFISGCRNKHENGEEISSSDTTHIKITQSQPENLPGDFLVKFNGYGIEKDNISLVSVSSDSQSIALVLDSAVRFGPEDEMWSQDLPSDWFGIRHRRILLLYYPSFDSLTIIAECEEIVNFYDVNTSLPVQKERYEEFAAVGWSPDGSCLFVLKDREAEEVSSQDILVFRKDIDEPVFVDIFPVWQQVMTANSDAKGTSVEEIGWAGNTTIMVLISVKDKPEAGLLELYFDAFSGELLSSRPLSRT